MARIGWFLLFLITSVVYFVVTAYVQDKQKKVLSSRKGTLFFWNQINILIGLIPIIVVPWILAGFFSRRFLLLTLAAFEITAFLTFLAYYFSRLTSRTVSQRFALWGGEMGLTHPFVMIIPTLLLLLLLVGYFIAATYVYFANPVHSDNAIRRMLMLNFALFIMGALLNMLMNVSQLSSAQINDRTRRAFFLAQIPAALQSGLFLTVYLGLTGVRSERFLSLPVPVPANFVQYVPFAALTLFYVVILIIPYFAGLENRRRAETQFFSACVDQINSIIGAIGIPDEHDVEQLVTLRTQLEQDSHDWIQSEPIVREVAAKVEEGSVLADPFTELAEPYRTFRDQDLRFVRYRWNQTLKTKLDEIIAQYQQYATRADKVEMFILLNRPLFEYFRDQRQGFESKLRNSEERKILAPVLARLVAVIGVVPAVVQYGQKLIGILPIRH